MSDSKKRKVGIMGGTFDPIHIGHLILAEKAYEQFDLEKVLVMPSGNPPHKQNRRGRGTIRQRVEMVQLAITDNPHFEISLVETPENGYTYTNETLKRLNKLNPDIEYYFILGADSLFSFENWKYPDEICKECTIVVAVRDHVSNTDLNKQIKYLTNKFQAKILKLETYNIDVSSKMIRILVQEEKTIKYYVPDVVMDYIRNEALYKDIDSFTIL